MLTNSEWCIQCHRNTNHYYDKYLPYEFHLRMVNQVAHDFSHLIPKGYYIPIDNGAASKGLVQDYTQVIYDSTWGHDLFEDTRKSYNDIKETLGIYCADIIFAVSNEKGKTRDEKANEKYYEGIRNTPGAVFVKLCDRIANVQYGKLTKSSMFDKYKKENDHFLQSLGLGEKDHSLTEMAFYLNDLLNN